MLHVNRHFIAGFASAVASLGSEGDQRGFDWSKPYEYLKGMLANFEEEKPKEIAGIKIVVSEAVAPGVVEFHHADGRVDQLRITGEAPRPVSPPRACDCGDCTG